LIAPQGIFGRIGRLHHSLLALTENIFISNEAGKAILGTLQKEEANEVRE
jgi:hypothetical protein